MCYIYIQWWKKENVFWSDIFKISVTYTIASKHSSFVDMIKIKCLSNHSSRPALENDRSCPM